jgi:hypothetical protein
MPIFLTPIKKDVNFNPMCGYELPHSKNIEDQWGTVLNIGDPDMIMSCLTCSTLSVWLGLHNACSLERHWQTYLPSKLPSLTPGRQYVSLYPNAIPKRGTGGSYVEKPMLRLDSLTKLPNHLAEGPNSDSEGLEFKSHELTLIT